MDPLDTPVFPQDPVSITEATKKFFAGKTRSPYYGDLPRTSTLTQPENRAQADNLVGHDSHAPLPPQEPMAEADFPRELSSELDSGAAQSLLDSSEQQTADQDPPEDRVDDDLTGDPTRQQVFFVQGRSDKCLVMDHETNECFFLKWKTLKKDQRKGRELDPRYYNVEEEKAFVAADAK